MRRISLLFLFLVCVTVCDQLKAQSLLFPNSIRYPLSREMPNSLVYADEHKSLEGYVRGSGWGAGEDFDYASVFSEIAARGEFTKGFTEGYGFVVGEVRLRNGEFFGDNETQTEIRDMYIGYKNDDVEFTLGNQNIQWGRGIGANPTNNLSPSDGFFLSTTGDDQKMYNFMFRSKVNINSNLIWEVVGIPIYKMSKTRLDLLNIPVATGNDSIPDKSFKNGAIATKLNLDGGPIGASISYYNGYSATSGVNTGYDVTTGAYAFNQSFRKQVFGADFMYRFSGKANGKSTDPTNDLMIAVEIGYTDVEEIADEEFLPQSNLEYSIGLIKQFWNSTRLDNFTMIIGYHGKYTPDYEDPGDDIEKLLAQQMFGQYNTYVQGITGIFTKTLMNQKFSATLVANYGITEQPDDDEMGHSFMVYPQVTWKITDGLVLSGGYFNLGGAGSDVASPVLNGASLGLKYKFKVR